MRVEVTQQAKCVQSVIADRQICKAPGAARLPGLLSQTELDAVASSSEMSSKLAAVAGFFLSGAFSLKLLTFGALAR